MTVYIFDTSSFSKLKHYYPSIFITVWTGLDAMVSSGEVISTREVWSELQNGSPDQSLTDWISQRKKVIFTTPCVEELLIVSEILKIKHFQSLIGKKQTLKGTPVADPFIVACAKHYNGCVVTEECFKENSSKIPNVCEAFDVECINLETFMQRQGWTF
ncbi:hypothetical protein F889_02181 [Acinetobacter colistiniresistens]|uniref:DUF4411 family protein n=1 Tax=Acinetobacter colistiniresistens TaxID=280145 RepID=N9R4I2_9GAMM|nr:PIN domain-containing protein [Acinetobacter colistiniresistens]ENX33520.1 hypothetical protein F889_02181 [Acinetobacter colistiniresistens]